MIFAYAGRDMLSTMITITSGNSMSDAKERAWRRIWLITDQVRPTPAQAAKPIEITEREILEDVNEFRLARRERRK